MGGGARQPAVEAQLALLAAADSPNPPPEVLVELGRRARGEAAGSARLQAFEAAASTGDEESRVALAHLLGNTGVAADRSRAMALYRGLADGGRVDAWGFLGALLPAEERARERERIEGLLLAAAERGDPHACYYLGQSLASAPQTRARGLAYLRRVAPDHPQAALEVQMLELCGSQTAASAAARAEADPERYALALGEVTRFGMVPPPTLVERARPALLRLALVGEEQRAAAALGSLLCLGGDSLKAVIAVGWLEAATDRGQDFAPLLLSSIYWRRDGLRRAARGIALAEARAYTQQARLLLAQERTRGELLPFDLTQAKELLRPILGHPEAKQVVGAILDYEGDAERARPLLEAALGARGLRAQILLASLELRDGRLARAQELLWAGARAREAEASLLLGRLVAGGRIAAPPGLSARGLLQIAAGSRDPRVAGYAQITLARLEADSR